MGALHHWLRDNGLSITFFALFLVALAVQSVTGLFEFNARLSAHHHPPIPYGAYLATGDFLDSIFVNTQAALLQLGCLILFSEVLSQKGASHSRKPQHGSGRKEPGHRSWLYRNSLSIAFILMFIGSTVAHIFFGASAYNETRAMTGDPPISAAQYLASADFWFKATQTWQAEFFGIGAFIVLSIFLRQEGSAESKPVDSKDDDTGETNR